MRYTINRITNKVPRTQAEKDKHLFIAAREGHTKRVKELLSAGANVNTFTPKGDPLITLAILNGHMEIIDEFLSGKYDVNISATNIDGYTPLHAAAFKGDIGTALTITDTDKKASLNVFSEKSGYTSLHFAAYKGHADMVELLINLGANKEAVTNNGSTPLHIAAREGKTNTVIALLNNGANENAQNKHGQTALDLARRNKKHTRTIAALSQPGIDIYEMTHLDVKSSPLDRLTSPLSEPLKAYRERRQQKRKKAATGKSTEQQLSSNKSGRKTTLGTFA